MNNPIHFSEGIYFEDVIFTIKAVYYVKTIGVVKLPLYHYRRREGSITSSASKKKIADMFTSLGIVKDFLEEEGVFNQYQSEYLIRFLTHGICYNFLDYFKLSNKEMDVELNEYMNKLRKSKFLRQENLLLLKHTISELGDDEARSKSFFVMCHSIMFSLMYSYNSFKIKYKIFIFLKVMFNKLFECSNKINLFIAKFRLLVPCQRTGSSDNKVWSINR